MGPGATRIEIQVPPPVRTCELRLAQFFIDSRQIVVSVGKIRAQAHSHAQMIAGGSKVPQLIECSPQIEMHQRVVRIAREGAPEILQRPSQVAMLVKECPEIDARLDPGWSRFHRVTVRVNCLRPEVSAAFVT